MFLPAIHRAVQPLEEEAPGALRFRVSEARLEDIESGAVRIAAERMAYYRLEAGDLVKLETKRPIFARVFSIRTEGQLLDPVPLTSPWGEGAPAGDATADAVAADTVIAGPVTGAADTTAPTDDTMTPGEVVAGAIADETAGGGAPGGSNNGRPQEGFGDLAGGVSALAETLSLTVGAIELDGMLRENAQVSLDDLIHITPHPVLLPARTLLLSCAQPERVGVEEIRRVRQWLQGRPLTEGDRLRVPLFSRSGTVFQVVSFEPPQKGCLATAGTDIRIRAGQGSLNARRQQREQIKYEDLGGLNEELARIREMIELPLRHPQLLAQLRIEPPRGVLLHGPPGTGKTTIARAVAGEVKAHFIQLDGPEIIHKFYGESEAKLRELFEEAQRRAPSIIFIDEIDAIAPKRTSVAGDVEKRVVAQLLALMDGMHSRGQVVVIGATNLPDTLDGALRRPGRFDRELAVRVPSRPGRLQILRIHSRGMPLAEDVDLAALAKVTHGFVGADLEVLCKEAGMRALREWIAHPRFPHDVPQATMQIRMGHFLESLKSITPTATRELFAEKTSVSWRHVGGQGAARDLIQASVARPRHFPTLYRRAGVGAPAGILLSGPSGSGKTWLVHALANESGFSFISVSAATLFSKWVGESEKTLREVFVKARQAAPSLLLFDDIDTLFPSENKSAVGGDERLLGQFLAEFDRLAAWQEVTVIATTSRPERLDAALRGAGRFGIHIALKPLDAAGRSEVLRIHAPGYPLADDVDLEALALAGSGCTTAAELVALLKRASYEALQRFIEVHGEDAERQASAFALSQDDLQRALRSVGNER